MQQNRDKNGSEKPKGGYRTLGLQPLFVRASFAGMGAGCSVPLRTFGLKWSGNVVRRAGCVCVSWKEGESIY